MQLQTIVLIIGFTFLGMGTMYAIQPKTDPNLTKTLQDPSRIIIDVRTQAEYKEGHIKNAFLIPHTEIKEKIEKVVPSKTTPIIVYCRSGRRSEIAKEILKKMNYQHVVNAGGYTEFKKREK